MNRIYAILIMLYCWRQTHPQQYIGLQECHSPVYNPFKPNQSIPRFTLSYQEILRKLLLPYHHQLPYSLQIPSPYYHNESLQHDTSPHRYLLFYYNTYYHQKLPRKLQHLQYPSSYYHNASHGQKPSSGYLLFYYNTYYYNSTTYNHEIDELYTVVEQPEDEIQKDILQWQTTPITKEQEGWSYSRMLALTPHDKADKNQKIPRAKNLILNQHNLFETCIHSDIGQSKTFACILLNKLERAKTYAGYNGEWLSIMKSLNNVTSNVIINGILSENFKTINNMKFNNTFEHGSEIHKTNFSTDNFLHLERNNLTEESRNDFTYAKATRKNKHTNTRARTLYCPSIYNLRNKTYVDEIIRFYNSSCSRQVTPHDHVNNQMTSYKNFYETDDNKINCQKKHNCTTKCVCAHTCCK